MKEKYIKSGFRRKIRIDKRIILVAAVLSLLSLVLLGTSVTAVNVDPTNNTTNVILETPKEALFIGSYAKVPVIINPNSSLTMDSLNFTIPDGPKGGIVSLSLDKDFNPEKPDVMLCAGYSPGTYTLQALNNSTVVGEAKFNVTDLWKNESGAGPSLCFEGAVKSFATGAAWGGGPTGPQNINVDPALGTRHVAILLVDTSSNRFTPAEATQYTKLFQDNAFNTTAGAKSARLFYQEASYGNFDIDGQVYGPVSLSGTWDDYFDASIDHIGNPKAGFEQSSATAGNSLINFNNVDSLVIVSKSKNATAHAWPQAWGNTLKTAQGDKSLGIISMPVEWSTGFRPDRLIYSTIAHELGHNLGLPDDYNPDTKDGTKYGSVIGARIAEGWEPMVDEDLLPHFSIAHRMMLGWIQPGWIQTFNFASMGTPVDQVVSLNPIEKGQPPVGKNIGIEVRVADGFNYYFEYRIGQSYQIGDRQLPVDSRILGTDIASPSWTPPILRPDVLLLSNSPGHGDGPVLGNEQFYTETVRDPMYPTDFKASVSGIDGSKADVHIQYGVNSKPDPSIRPWPAGPDRQWQSPDIEVQNDRTLADPAWFNVPWVGHQNTVIANVKNAGNIDAPSVEVDFYVKDYNIGNAPETLIDSVVQDIAKGATIQFKTTWIPPKEGHFCIIVRVPLYFRPGPPPVVEMTELNNVAQSNYDRFISSESVPSREMTTLEVGNPYPNTTRVFIVPGQSNPLYRTYVESTSVVLGPMETKKVKVMFEYIGDKIIPEKCRQAPPINIATKAAGLSENELPESCIPNNIGITGYIEDPRDPHTESKQVLGGVQAQVVTGLSTKFQNFSVVGGVANGTIISVDDGRPVPGGKVILILTKGCGKSQIETYQTVDVSSGDFSATIQGSWDSIEAYYVPLIGYGDSTSQQIVKNFCGEIHGMKFNDLNGNGIKENGEPGLANWTITLKNETGSVSTTLTDANGNYSFTNITAGNYTVGEVKQSGWIQTAPAVSLTGSATYTITISTSGQNETNKDFGNFKFGEVHGQKFEDLNANGIRDTDNFISEIGLAGWQINLTGTDTITNTSVSMTTTTDANGNYEFTGLTAGTYTVTETLQNGWVQTAPSTVTYTVTITSGSNITGQNFGNFHKGKITGGGWISITGDPKATFGITGQYPDSKSAAQGNVEYQDHKANLNIKSIQIKTVATTLDKKKGAITGLVQVNGKGSYPFVVYVEDNGEPGKSTDVFKISLPTYPYSNGAIISSGNIQIHN